MVLISRILALVLAVSYSYLGYVDVLGPLSMGVITLFCLSSIMILLQLTNRRYPTHKVLGLIIVIAILCIWTDTVINGEFRLRAIQQFVTPIAVFLSAFGIIYCLRFTTFYLYSFASLLVLSCLVAIFQGLDIDFAWELRYAFPASDDKMVEYQLMTKSKPAGLSFYAVQLGYQMVLACLLLLILNARLGSRDSNRFIILGLIIIFLAAVIGLNLSALISISIMLYVHSGTQRQFRIRGIHIFIAILFLAGAMISPIGQRILSADASMLSRVTFTIVGILLVVNNPFGVPTADLYQAKLEIVNQLYGSGSFVMLEDILDMGLHNSFLNVGVQLGWVGLFLYLYFYFSLTKYFYTLIRSKSLVESKLGSIGFSFMLGYLVQIMTHNAGPFNIDIYFWFGIGFLLAMVSVEKEHCRRLGNGAI